MILEDRKSKDRKKVYQENVNQREAGVATLVSDKIDFGAKDIPRDSEAHAAVTKGSIYPEHVAILNVHAPSNT